ncbi:unnamed protein product [Aureobasidium mustum]|uniref:Uncharacterized protein n=1 Tax=Aureobasidium mustum TaxID=2773714 RepID=A0A9N8JIA6_9PEZI|nr:unnamed protein product [Aureobasidium mustum]
MCWGTQDYIFCCVCREETPFEINWHGCHLQVGGIDSPICPEPIITKLHATCTCQTCINEADDGGDPDDIYPEPFDHPGFPDTKPVIEVDRVELPEPTAYESFWKFENLAGTDLPSHEDAMNEMPSPPWFQVRVREEAVHEQVIADAVYTTAVERLQGLMKVARNRREDIRRYTLNHAVPDKALLEFAYEIIESLLSEQEQRNSRISSLQKLLESITKDINLEGLYYPSPPEMTLLKYKREAIMRELEEKFINHFKLPTPED